jgi:hypothetical protein
MKVVRRSRSMIGSLKSPAPFHAPRPTSYLGLFLTLKSQRMMLSGLLTILPNASDPALDQIKSIITHILDCNYGVLVDTASDCISEAHSLYRDVTDTHVQSVIRRLISALIALPGVTVKNHEKPKSG